MFEQSLVEAGVRTRRPWTVGVSVLMQTALVSVALLIPLVNPEMLPRAAAVLQVIAPPSPPQPPPPDQPPTAMARPAAQPPPVGGPLFEPQSIPARVAILVEPPAPQEGSGVRGALPSDWAIGSNRVMESLASLAARAPAAPPEVKKPPAETAATTIRITRGGQVQDALLVNKVIPIYPPIARAAGVQGRVSFSAIIGRDGAIMNLQVLSGHPLLRQAALDAVRLWRYRPTLLNGVPVEVATTIDVNFTISR